MPASRHLIHGDLGLEAPAQSPGSRLLRLRLRLRSCCSCDLLLASAHRIGRSRRGPGDGGVDGTSSRTRGRRGAAQFDMTSSQRVHLPNVGEQDSGPLVLGQWCEGAGAQNPISRCAPCRPQSSWRVSLDRTTEERQARRPPRRNSPAPRRPEAASMCRPQRGGPDPATRPEPERPSRPEGQREPASDILRLAPGRCGPKEGAPGDGPRRV